jgi:hypothetical protein
LPCTGSLSKYQIRLSIIAVLTDARWLKNTIHVIISGVYGSWYFAPNSPAKGATRGAFKRAVTYSFGSISLGSLLVAIIQFLRQICSAAQRNASADGNMVGAILFCILGCLIGILNWATLRYTERATLLLRRKPGGKFANPQE